MKQVLNVKCESLCSSHPSSSFNYSFKNTVFTVTQGHIICQLVSMFQSIDELRDENDRCCTLALDEDEDGDREETDYPLEHIQLVVHLFHPASHYNPNSQCCTFWGYNLLVRYMPGIEAKLLDLELPQLSIFFRDVWPLSAG